ncbi:hypothetical protein Tco_0588531 [Tanacetum coccineum]
MPTHNRIYIAPSHTKKIFGNMRRVGKGFSGRETPLFQTMVVQAQAKMGEVDEAIYNELDGSLVRATTAASSLEALQDSGNIAKTRSKVTPNESGSLGTTSGGNTLRIGEDSLKLNVSMELCTNLQTRVLDLEKTKTTQAEEIVSLKRRVKKLKQKKRLRTHGLKRLYKVGLTARVESYRDEESLDDADMFDVNTLTGDEVLAEQEVATKDVNLTVNEVTLAQALTALKSVKPKVKANVVEDPSIPVSAASTKVSVATTTTTATILTLRKGIVITELGWKHKDLKSKDFDSIKELFDKAFKKVNMFVDYRTDLVEGSSKRAGDELEQEGTKKQKVDDVQETAKVDDDQEAAKIKELMKIIPNEDEVASDAIPLATKPPTIVDWKIHK